MPDRCPNLNVCVGVPTVGERYGYSEHPFTLGCPIQPVEVLKLGPRPVHKVRVRWLDGEYEGLDQWVSRVCLVVAWDEAEEYVRDEQHLCEALEASGDVYRSVRWLAVQEAFFAIPGLSDISMGDRGHELTLLVIDDLASATKALGLEPEEMLAKPHAYADRHGRYIAPFGVAEMAAQLCCRRYSSTVLEYLKREQVEIRKALERFERFPPEPDDRRATRLHARRVRRLRDTQQAHERIREWCGAEACEEFSQLEALQSEVEHLRALAGAASRALQPLSRSSTVRELIRELDGAAAGGTNSESSLVQEPTN